MKISQKGPFQKGYNAIVKEEVNKDMGMDFGVLCMDQGDVVEYNEPKEVVYTLTNGVITGRTASTMILSFSTCRKTPR